MHESAIDEAKRHVRQNRNPEDYGWIMFTDGSCYENVERIYGSAAWILNTKLRVSQTVVAGGTEGDTDRSELLALNEGLRRIHKELDPLKGSSRILWITDRESLALQVATDPATGIPWYTRRHNLDLWAGFDYLSKKLDLTVKFMSRNNVYGQCIVDALSRKVRTTLTESFPALVGDKPGDASGWVKTFDLTPVKFVEMQMAQHVRRKHKHVVFSPKDPVTDVQLEDLLGVLRTNEYIPVFKDGIAIPTINA